MPRHLQLVALLAALTLVGCKSDSTGPAAIPAPTPSFVRLQSDAGDWVGSGKSYEYSKANTLFSVSSLGNHLNLRLQGDQQWSADFQGAGGSAHIQPGTYTGLTRYAFSGGNGGIEWTGEGHGCNTITGSFTVDSVKYSVDALTAIDMRFEQHCEGGTAALRGTIHWFAGDTTSPPGPSAIPAGLWQPPAGALPTTGNSVYLQSDQGDFIGRGLTWSYNASNSTVSVSTGTGMVTVSVAGWSGEFKAMNTITQLRPGYYPGLHRYPFNNPVKGGMDWGGNGSGCNTLDGWFAVDRVTYTGTTITALDLRFEQHCDSAAPALRGAIHFGS